MNNTGFTGRILLSFLTLSATSHARARDLSGAMRDLSLLSAYALAVAEDHAAGGVVVPAPTIVAVVHGQ